MVVCGTSAYYAWDQALSSLSIECVLLVCPLLESLSSFEVSSFIEGFTVLLFITDYRCSVVVNLATCETFTCSWYR